MSARLIRFLFAIGLTLVFWRVPAPAQLNIPQKSAVRWKKYFGGAPLIPNPRKDLQGLMKFPGFDACEAPIKELLDDVDAYAQAAFDSEFRLAASKREAIQALLFKKLGETHACFKPTTLAYAVASVSILDPTNFFPYNMVRSYRRPRLAGGSISMDGDGPSPVDLPVILFAAALANQGNIVPLTGKVRTRIGRGWDDPLTWRHRHHRFIGGTSCLSMSVYFEPHLSPYDLGTEIFHEMEHLFGDHSFELAQVKKLFPSTDDDIDWRQYLLMGEVVANLHAAYRQHFLKSFVRYSMDNRYDWLRHRGLRGIPFDAYRISGDFSFFSRNGNLRKLFVKSRNTPEAFAQFLQTQVFPPATGVATPMRGKLVDLIADVSRVYFPEEADKSFEFANAALQRNLTGAFSPFSEWIRDAGYLFKIDTTLRSPWADWMIHQHCMPEGDGCGTNEFGHSMSTDTLPISWNMEWFFDELDRFFTKAALGPTPLCVAFEQAVHKKQVGSYAGGADDDPLQDGEVGVKPGEVGVKPCAFFKDRL